jgi:hypothetical protein
MRAAGPPPAEDLDQVVLLGRGHVKPCLAASEILLDARELDQRRGAGDGDLGL